MRPPQHSVDAPAVFVLHDDPAWDIDRIERECEGLDDPDSHPYAVYLRGETRYQLDAPVKWSGGDNSASEYLTGEPVRFHLDRLSVMDMTKIQDAFRREFSRHGDDCSFLEVYALAAKLGLKEISGAPELDMPRGARVGDSVLRNIVDAYGSIAAVTAIGIAAWNLSKPLTDAEKKL